MHDIFLKKLADIATVRQHINGIVHSVDRKFLNKIQKIGKDLDLEFVELLLKASEEDEQANSNNYIVEKPLDLVAEKMPVNFVKFGDSEDDTVRPKIKTSKKTAKNNAPEQK